MSTGHGPHPDDPVKRDEHLALFDLVPIDQATRRAVQTGKWSDPQTWEAGQLPTVIDRVHIPADVSVLVDTMDAEAHWMRVDGGLRFTPDNNTKLRIDTLIISHNGRFELGTPTEPIRADVTAKVVFSGDQDIDRQWDPYGLSRGLIAHGSTSICGAEKTPFVAFRGNKAGDTTIELDTAPQGWRIGDRLIFSGARYGEHEEAILAGIDGQTITIETNLQFDRTAPADDLRFHVGNLTRNVVFESEAPGHVLRAGHIMFLHNDNVQVHNAAAIGLGRSDKSSPFHATKISADGSLTPGTNVSGRYAWHFHRAGNPTNPEAIPAQITGCVAIGSPGFGFVNHSSYVEMTGNVAYDIFGSAFVAEAGDEIGTVEGCLAIHSRGSGSYNPSINPRSMAGDEPSFGHEGTGFWFQSAGIRDIDNIAANHRTIGIVHYSEPLKQPGIGETLFTALWWLDPDLAAEYPRGIPTGRVPFTAENLTSYGNGDKVFSTHFNLQGPTSGKVSRLDGLVGWGTKDGIGASYAHNEVIRNVRLYGTSLDTGIGIMVGTKTLYEDIRVEGFDTGLLLIGEETRTIRGGYLDNRRNIATTARRASWGRNFTFEAIEFGPQAEFDIHYRPGSADDAIERFFDGRNVLLLNGQQLYLPSQAPDYVFDHAGMPPELRGLTARNIWDRYRLAVQDAIAPADVAEADGIDGFLVGSPATYLPDMRLVSKRYPSQLEDYTLILAAPDGQQVTVPGLTIQPNQWNFFAYLDPDGNERTAMVYGAVADVQGPQVNSAQAVADDNGVVDRVILEFSEPIATPPLDAFSAIMGPEGATPIRVIEKIDDQTWLIGFTPRQAKGLYTFTVGTEITDKDGNALDQGDESEDVDAEGRYIAEFTVNPLSDRWSRRFDFGTSLNFATTAPGFVPVLASDAYDPFFGHGWTAGKVLARDRKSGSALERDFVFTSKPATFQVDLPNGDYDVTVTQGDASTWHDRMGIELQGELVGDVSTSKGEFARQTFRVQVTDGRLLVTLKSLGGRDPNAVLNGLEIVQVECP